MSAVISVQKHTITLPAGTASVASPTLDPVVVTANCIPFVTSRVTTDSNFDDLGAYAVDAYFSGSTVVVETGVETLRAMVVEVTVVEFNSSEIAIQQGIYAMTSAEASDAPAISEVTLDATFLYHTWQADTADDVWQNFAVRGEFTGSGTSTALAFTREAGAVTGITGNWYTAEATAGTPYWTVKPISVTVSAATSNTGTIIPPVSDLTQTFLIGSHSAPVPDDDTYAATANATITDASTLTVTRMNAAESTVGRYFVVEFKAAASDAVQRGVLAVTTAAPTHNVNLPSTVTEADSMVHTSGATGSFSSGSHSGGASQAVPDSWSSWVFVDADNIEIEHSQVAFEDDYNVTWEVIEWDVGGAPLVTRRVFIIS